MAKPKGFYTAESGSYSDYRVHGLFNDRKAAQAHVDQRNKMENWREARVGWLPLFEDEPKRLPLYFVARDIHAGYGVTGKSQDTTRLEWEYDIDTRPVSRAKLWTVHEHLGVPDEQRIVVDGTDREAVQAKLMELVEKAMAKYEAAKAKQVQRDNGEPT